MSQQDLSEGFDWKVERPAFIKNLPKNSAKLLGTAAFAFFFLLTADGFADVFLKGSIESSPEGLRFLFGARF
ncbi:MAG: hypothetical protein ACR2PH_07375 [Desulfobulbia bacterium]